MTEHTLNNWTTPDAPTRKPRKRRRWVTPVAVTAALLAGVGIGAAGQPEPETRVIDRPVEVEPEVITETVTEEIEVTPAAFLEYIDYADQVIDSATIVIGAQGESLGLAGEVIGNPYAATQAGIDQLEGNTATVEEQTARIENLAPDMVSARTACEAAQ